MQRFRLKGIKPPGRVNLPRIGTVQLADISDELAEQLYKDGCSYLEPIHDHSTFPPINNREIKVRKKIKTP